MDDKRFVARCTFDGQQLPHILHLALAIRNRGYTNVRVASRREVCLRGLTQNQQPAEADKVSCSRDF
ncbi:hypothetical protein [Nostoc sp.]|uniref:hypothetical protein n=1 Tax=Nostoc sp. TaxID=1180 RepID=UPI002FFC53AA